MAKLVHSPMVILYQGVPITPANRRGSRGLEPAAYLMKGHISDPVIILLVCGDSVRQVKPAARERARGEKKKRKTFLNCLK